MWSIYRYTRKRLTPHMSCSRNYRFLISFLKRFLSKKKKNQRVLLLQAILLNSTGSPWSVRWFFVDRPFVPFVPSPPFVHVSASTSTSNLLSIQDSSQQSESVEAEKESGSRDAEVAATGASPASNSIIQELCFILQVQAQFVNYNSSTYQYMPFRVDDSCWTLCMTRPRGDVNSSSWISDQCWGVSFNQLYEQDAEYI